MNFLDAPHSAHRFTLIATHHNGIIDIAKFESFLNYPALAVRDRGARGRRGGGVAVHGVLPPQGVHYYRSVYLTHDCVLGL